MTVFADSSALVKLYVDEEHHGAMRAIDEPIVISVIAEVEVPAALWRKQRMGEISRAQASSLCAAFEADLAGVDLPGPRFARVLLSDDVVETAQASVARHPLRAYDAVQLSTAMVARASLRDVHRFAVFDRTLRSAASLEGFDLVPRNLGTPEGELV